MLGHTDTLSAIEVAKDLSNDKFDDVRKRVDAVGIPINIALIVVGSYARCEANCWSDFDYFVYEPEKTKSASVDIHTEVNKIIQEQGISPPAHGGAFGEGSRDIESFVQNIGGENETNDSLTRRLLLLLASRCLAGNDKYNELRTKLINRYIEDRMTEHGLARFLLNDIIKYYRTVCVDFEYKTVEGNKDWGIRNIKLMFARKLIYFSGLLVVAETAQRFWPDKREILESLLSVPPIQRIQKICGSRSDAALQSYNHFLQKMASAEFRKILQAVQADRNTHTHEFRALKNEAHHFSWALMRLLAESYPATHPIHQAIIF